MLLRSSHRKVELYQVDWLGLDLGQMFVAAAPHGGPLAVVRDWKQFVKATTSGKPVIKIFTCSGNLLATINVSVGYLRDCSLSTFIFIFSGIAEIS